MPGHYETDPETNESYWVEDESIPLKRPRAGVKDIGDTRIIWNPEEYQKFYGDPYANDIKSTEHAGTIMGYGDRLIADKSNKGIWTNALGGEPVSPEYVKEIQDTMAAFDRGEISEDEIRRRAQPKENIPGRPTDQELTSYDRFKKLVEMATPGLEAARKKGKDDYRRNFSGMDELLENPKETQARILATEEAGQRVWDREYVTLKSFFDKQEALREAKTKEAPLGFSIDNRPVTKNAVTGALVYGDTQEPYKGGPLKPLTDVNAAYTTEIPNVSAQPPGVKNEAALQGVTSADAAIIKSLAEYKIPLPTGFALRSPYWQNILSRTSLYDSSFDATQYNVRLAVKKDFTSGKSAINIRSLNTAVGHLDTLAQKANALNNAPIKIWNWIANAGLNAVGDKRVVEFNNAATAVESELAAVFKGMGATDQEIKVWRENLSNAQSPEQLKGAIDTAIILMGSRLDALTSGYERGLGKPKDINFLDVKSQKILTKLGANIDALDPVIYETTGKENKQDFNRKPRLTPAQALEELRRRGKI